MMFDQSLFGITPETFQPVDVDFTGGENFLVVDPKMPVTTKHQGIVTAELVGIDYTSSTNFFNRQVQKRLGAYVGEDFYLNQTLPFQNAENRDFMTSTPSAFTFTFASKISLVHLYFTFDQITVPLIHCYAPSDQVHRLEYRRITYSDLFGNLSGGELQFKQFDDPEPVYGTYAQLTQPSTSPFRKRIATPFTSITTIHQSVDFIAPAPYAEMTVVFPQPFCQESSGRFLLADNQMKRFYVHSHQYNWCQMFYNHPN
jgi:hypothetical protein